MVERVFTVNGEAITTKLTYRMNDEHVIGGNGDRKNTNNDVESR